MRLNQRDTQPPTNTFQAEIDSSRSLPQVDRLKPPYVRPYVGVFLPPAESCGVSATEGVRSSSGIPRVESRSGAVAGGSGFQKVLKAARGSMASQKELWPVGFQRFWKVDGVRSGSERGSAGCSGYHLVLSRWEAFLACFAVKPGG